MSEPIGAAIEPCGIVHTIHTDGKVTKSDNSDSYYIRFSTEGTLEYTYYLYADVTRWAGFLVCCTDKDFAHKVIEIYTTYIVETGLLCRS